MTERTFAKSINILEYLHPFLRQKPAETFYQHRCEIIRNLSHELAKQTDLKLKEKKTFHTKTLIVKFVQYHIKDLIQSLIKATTCT